MIESLQARPFNSYVEIKVDGPQVDVAEHWNDIVDVAKSHGSHLPATPDRAALVSFMHSQRLLKPASFSTLTLDLSRAMGPAKIVRQTVRTLPAFSATAPSRKASDLDKSA
jgi:hypothetical protein